MQINMGSVRDELFISWRENYFLLLCLKNIAFYAEYIIEDFIFIVYLSVFL